MKKLILFIMLFSLFFTSASPTYAIVNPLERPNNKIGIHILFPDELEEAAKLVNGNGGEWGYVTIPIQSGDKDMVKWQKFMDDCQRLKLIPIIRISTEGDYFNTKVWRKPTEHDITDFANFLNSLHWPTTNRYVMIFNEVNRGDEWGGAQNPTEYAKILEFAATTFKASHPDFFIISAGLDNAAPNQGKDYANQYTYMAGMESAVPGIFTKVDGLGSHSYPNPGFSQHYAVVNQMSIASFKFERQLAESFGGKKLPVFITETGWTSEKIADKVRADYYFQALNSTWKDDGIVTVAPFLLRAGGGPFQQFSFLTDDGKETSQYTMLKSFPKVKGTPVMPPKQKVLASSIISTSAYPTRRFELPEDEEHSLSDAVQSAFKWIMKL